MEILEPEKLLEASHYIVLNKPAGMIVNNADTSRDVFTLQDFVDKALLVDKKGENEDFVSRSGIVHRLDKETSGAIIVALDDATFSNFQEQFKSRSVKKTYLALVHGKLVREGSINVPIGRLPWNRMRFGVISDGRESLTEFKVLKYYQIENKNKKETLSLVEVYPKTGRTHQIRVHMQYAGFPIFSDALYAGRKTYKSDKNWLKRHFLHASKIAFKDPQKGTVVEVEAPISKDLKQLLEILTPIEA